MNRGENDNKDDNKHNNIDDEDDNDNNNNEDDEDTNKTFRTQGDRCRCSLLGCGSGDCASDSLPVSLIIRWLSFRFVSFWLVGWFVLVLFCFFFQTSNEKGRIVHTPLSNDSTRPVEWRDTSRRETSWTDWLARKSAGPLACLARAERWGDS